MRVTVLPVLNNPCNEPPLTLTWALGLKVSLILSASREPPKQHDSTVQKLIIAAGREDELGPFFLRSFPHNWLIRSPVRHRRHLPRKYIVGAPRGVVDGRTAGALLQTDSEDSLHNPGCIHHNLPVHDLCTRNTEQMLLFLWWGLRAPIRILVILGLCLVPEPCVAVDNPA